MRTRFFGVRSLFMSTQQGVERFGAASGCAGLPARKINARLLSEEFRVVHGRFRAPPSAPTARDSARLQPRPPLPDWTTLRARYARCVPAPSDRGRRELGAFLLRRSGIPSRAPPPPRHRARGRFPAVREPPQVQSLPILALSPCLLSPAPAASAGPVSGCRFSRAWPSALRCESAW